jgi:alkaline phosphatase
MVRDSATDVVMGAGHPLFDQTGDPAKKPAYKFIGEAEFNDLKAGTAGGDANGDGTADPWTLVETADAFRALATGETPERVFGLAQVRRTLQADRAPLSQTWQPYEKEPVTGVPTLAEMTQGALNVLDGDPDGFFLMVEGGATDWAAHDSQLGLLIEEEVAFNEAVDAVVAWVEANSSWKDTMLVVTSDHETGYLSGPDSGETADGPAWNPIVSNGKGAMPGAAWHTVSHTNSLVPIFVKGEPGSLLASYVDGKDPKRGDYIDNTDINRLLRAALGAQPMATASPAAGG